MAVIGITGGFGTGKSTVAAIFEKLGAAVIDADKIAHEAILPDGPVYEKIVSIFGESILKADGKIDRKKLGDITFNDKRKRLLLNTVVHPEVIKRIRAIITEGRRSFYIIDAPLLIEAGLLDMIEELIVVTVSRQTQIERLKKKFGLSRKDIEKRIRSQIALVQKRRLADFIIDNNGSINATQEAVEKIWEEIKDGTRRDKD